MMFPTSIAGSLPKPSWLAEPNRLWAPWRLAGAATHRHDDQKNADRPAAAAHFVFLECGPGFGKCLRHRHFLKEGDGEHLEQSVEGGFQDETFLDDGDEDVNGNRDPDLRLHRVVRRAVEPFDPKMLLDPLEEKFDLPAALVL